MDRPLLREFLQLYPFQPATAVWRAPEVAALAQVAFPPGIGLDLGCGDGRLTRVLAEKVGGLQLVGLDSDPLETALAQREGLYDRVHTAHGDHIPEPDAAFDFVLSVSVMEHIPNLRDVLREVCRILRPGGRLIASVPGAGFHACLRGPLLPGFSRETYLRNVDRRVAHLRYWTTAEWREALTTAGMTLIEARPILSRADIRRWETLARLTAGVLHAVAGHRPPIEIQRSLSMRKPGQRLPRKLAALLGSILSCGLDETSPVDESESGCLLVIAQRAGFSAH